MPFSFPENPTIESVNHNPGLDVYRITEMRSPHVLTHNGQEIVRVYNNLDDQFSPVFQDLRYFSVLRKTLCRKILFTMK
jgi:hypothetical protein